MAPRRQPRIGRVGLGGEPPRPTRPGFPDTGFPTPDFPTPDFPTPDFPRRLGEILPVVLAKLGVNAVDLSLKGENDLK